MSKCANMLKMLMLLRSARDKMKSRELADRLSISPRMVRKYKEELEQVGVYIGSTPGRYGGYYIEADNNILNLGIDEQDFSVLKIAEEYLKQDNFMFMNDYEMILDKINSNLSNKGNLEDISNLVLESSPNLDQEEEKLKYIHIQEAIMELKKVRINYMSLSSGLKERIIRPYAIYMYQGFWYVMGYCELRGELRQFKVVRIKELEVLSEGFKRPDDFSLGKYLEGCIGIVYDEEKFKVKLKIDYPISIKVSERIWVEDQQISFNDDNSIIFEAEMTGLDDIVHWVLSLGSSVEVLEPVELKDRVREEAKRIIEKV